MKKLFTFTFTFIAAVMTFAGCESLGLKNLKMNEPESVERVRKAIGENVDFSAYKLVSVHWYEVEELSNNLEYVALDMFGNDGELYNQVIKVGGDYQGPAELKKATINRYKNAGEVKSLSLDDIDSDAVMKSLEAAISQIDAESYDFRSVSDYMIAVDARSGEKACEFTLRIVDKEGHTGIEGRNIVTTYYEVGFNVQPDGSVVMEEE